MSRDIPESDWRQFRKVHPVQLERFCQAAIEDLARTVQAGEGTARERFLRSYELLKDRHRDLSRIFDDFRRSTAILQLGIMRLEGLLADEELRGFSEDTQRSVETLASIYRGDSRKGQD